MLVKGATLLVENDVEDIIFKAEEDEPSRSPTRTYTLDIDLS